MKSFWFVALLLVVSFKQLLWISALPIFQTPDEQAHLAQLAYLAEHQVTKVPTNVDLSLEIATTEELLGTRRDSYGNNKFTYHPEFNITYSKDQTGIFEVAMATLSGSARTVYVGGEAAHYPPLGYVTSLPFYYLAYDSSLIERIFASRLLNLIIHLLQVLVAYKIGKTIWKKEREALVLGILVSFQPMISFVAAGIHPDNLLNLLYSLGLLFLLRVIRDGLRLKHLVGLGIVLVLGFYTKQLIFPFFPLALATLTYVLLKKKRLLALGSSLVVLLGPIPLFFVPISLPYLPLATVHHITLPEYLNFRLKRLVFEMWPWYWGVFRWLSLALPREVMRLITRVALLASVGIGIYFLKVVTKRQPLTFEAKAAILFLVSTLTYIIYLFLWDFRLMDYLGFSQGLQGRYLFPNIVAHLALFQLGIMTLFSFRKRLQQAVLGVLAAAMVGLNVVSWWLLSTSYYGTEWQMFLLRASQYKPDWIKEMIGLLIQ